MTDQISNISGQRSESPGSAMATAKRLRDQAKELRRQAKKIESEADNKGLQCPKCGCGHFYTDKTIDITGHRRRRYKVCRNCGRRVRTTEVIEME